jgi:hypothetical protein
MTTTTTTTRGAPFTTGFLGAIFIIKPTPDDAWRASFDARANRALRGTLTGESMAEWGPRYIREARAVMTLTQHRGTLWERVSR